MNRPGQITPMTIRTILVSLSDECPQSGNPESCPFHELRKKTFSVKRAWIRSLSDVELVEIYTNHLECTLRPITSH
jgi:hypothetical protein